MPRRIHSGQAWATQSTNSPRTPSRHQVRPPFSLVVVQREEWPFHPDGEKSRGSVLRIPKLCRIRIAGAETSRPRRQSTMRSWKPAFWLYARNRVQLVAVTRRGHCPTRSSASADTFTSILPIHRHRTRADNCITPPRSWFRTSTLVHEFQARPNSSSPNPDFRPGALFELPAP